MSVKDPNGISGKSESDVLEFKAKEILRSPAKIAREVVAFLNKKGGAIWIGYPEQGGVAGIPEVIPDADRTLNGLQNHLIDTIEPPVQIPDEVDLKVANGQIRVSVKAGRNGPYAQRDGGRHYWIRVGNRLRDMARDEIASAFRDQSRGDDRLDKVVTTLRRAQQRAVQEKAPSLWFRLVPSEALAIDLHDKATGETMRTWLTDATTTGNRRGGWHFALDLDRPPRLVGDRFTQGEPDLGRTEIENTGQVTYVRGRDDLYWKGNDNDPRDLYPYALLELPVSVFRLMAAILGRHGERHADLKVVGGFAISGLRGWRLKPGSPQALAVPSAGAKTFEEDVLEIDPEQLVFDADKLRDNPDLCGLRLVRLVYGAFGFEGSAIPPEFDQQRGVLRLG